MKILIPGGTGLIGQALTRELVSNGHTVILLSRSADKVAKISPNTQVLGWDGKTTAGWGHVINEIDAVVNLAGTPLNGNSMFDIWLTEKRKKSLLASRLDSASALIEAIQAADKKPKVFVQASAVGYYGFSGDEIIDETSPPGDGFLARVQQQNEKAIEELETMGIRCPLIRTGLVLDKTDGSLQYFLLQFSLFAGGRIGSGEQYYAWIHIRDEAAAIRFLLEDDRAAGPFNLTAPKPVKNSEFAKILGEVMHRPSFFVIPGFLMRWVLGEVSDVILKGARVVPSKLIQLGFEFQFPELGDALKDVLRGSR